MTDNPTVLLAFVALALIIWLFPRILGPLGIPSSGVKEEHLKRIGNLLAGFAVFIGICLQVVQYLQSWFSYQTSQSNLQLENGFKGLQSGDGLGRVSGINYLTILLNEDLIDPMKNYKRLGVNPCALSSARKYSSRTEMILRTLSASATIFSNSDENQRNHALINLEAREALRVVARVPGDKTFFDMRGGYFRGANIPYACLSSADLTGANFEGANLYESHFFAADLKGAKFSGANLAGADLSEADVQQAVFSEGQNFSDKRLKRCEKVKAQLSGASLYSATLTMADFKEANMRNAIFNNSIGERFTMERACLLDAHFKNANIFSSSFRGADARGADFSPKEDHKETQLHHIDFSNSNLEGANFSGAELKESIFYGANLTDANFTNAKIDENAFRDAYLCRTVWPDGNVHDTCESDKKEWKPSAEFLSCQKHDRHENAKPSEDECRLDD